LTPGAPFSWAAYLPPSTARALLIDQFFGCVAFLAVALLLSILRRRQRPFDIASVARAAVAGASLPATLTLAAVPFRPEVLTLFSDTTMQAYLMVGGVILSLLTIYGLLK
jgi:hypothetical protein